MDVMHSCAGNTTTYLSMYGFQRVWSNVLLCHIHVHRCIYMYVAQAISQAERLCGASEVPNNSCHHDHWLPHPITLPPPNYTFHYKPSPHCHHIFSPTHVCIYMMCAFLRTRQQTSKVHQKCSDTQSQQPGNTTGSIKLKYILHTQTHAAWDIVHCSCITCIFWFKTPTYDFIQLSFI